MSIEQKVRCGILSKGDKNVSENAGIAGKYGFISAKSCNYSQRIYRNYELGQRDIPTDVLILLADFYQVSIDYLLGQTNNPVRNL